MEWKSPQSCGAKKIERKYIAATGKAYHKLFPNGKEVIHNISKLAPKKGKHWELAAVTEESDEFYWGMFIEGLGFFEVMFPKPDTRPLTEEEKKFWSGRRMGMFGSHSGDLSYTFEIGEIK